MGTTLPLAIPFSRKPPRSSWSLTTQQVEVVADSQVFLLFPTNLAAQVEPRAAAETPNTPQLVSPSLSLGGLVHILLCKKRQHGKPANLLLHSNREARNTCRNSDRMLGFDQLSCSRDLTWHTEINVKKVVYGSGFSLSGPRPRQLATSCCYA